MNVKNVSPSNIGNVILFDKARIEVLSPRFIRLEKGMYVDNITQGVKFRDFPKVKFSYEHVNNSLTIFTEEATFYISLRSLRVKKVIYRDVNLTLKFNKFYRYQKISLLDLDINSLINDIDNRSLLIFDDSNSLIYKNNQFVKRDRKDKDYYVYAYQNDKDELKRCLLFLTRIDDK